MRLVDRLADRYRAQGYYEGLASGAAVLTTYGADDRREGAVQQVVAAAQQAYETNGVVFACILVRMMLLSEARFQLQRLGDKGLYGTPDLAVLERPWPGATSAELIARMEMHGSTAGNAFVWQAEPDELVMLPPDEVTIISEVRRTADGRRYRRVIGYDWDPTSTNLPGVGPGQGPSDEAQSLGVDEVAHWAPIPDPAARFRGMSWLTPAMREVEADSGLTAYKTAFLDHAATPNLLVQYPSRLQPQTVDRIVARLRERHGGVTNAYQALVLDQGATAQVVGSTFDQMDYSTVQGIGEDRVCAAAGVDPVLIGLLTIGRAAVDYLSAMRRLADLTCRPLWRSMCASLQKFVPNIPPAGVRLWFDLADVAALREGELQRAQATQVKAAALVSLRQAGATFDSAVAALQADDVGLLQYDPESAQPVSGQVDTQRPPYGTTTTQNPASKIPAPPAMPNGAKPGSMALPAPTVNGTSPGGGRRG